MSPEPDLRSGQLVLVVGPSGAGKDAIMRGARHRFAAGSKVRFARRVVTRPAHGSEDNEAATPDSFAEAPSRGEFVLDWQAHGLCYGVPRTVLDGLARGDVVVVNGSRAVVATARGLIGTVRVALVTAPAEVLEARIRARGRNEDAGARLARDVIAMEDLRPDVVIDNSGPLDASVGRFVEFLSDLT